jgi:hypothetical protein
VWLSTQKQASIQEKKRKAETTPTQPNDQDNRLLRSRSDPTHILMNQQDPGALVRSTSTPHPKSKSIHHTSTEAPQPTPHIPWGVTRTLQRSIRSSPIQACFDCALPYALEHNNIPHQPRSQLPDDHAAWEQVCSTIHAINPHPLQSTNKKWTNPTSPLRHRNHQDLLGQTVLLHPHRTDLPARTGTIILIAENGPHNATQGNPSVYVRPDDLKPPHIPTPRAKCDILDTHTFTYCAECNRPRHPACTPKRVTTPSDKWHCRSCTTKTRIPHTIQMTLTETHASIKRFTKKANSRRTAETEQKAKDLKSIESKYPHEEIIVLASPPPKIRTTTKKNMFNGPWQPEMADKQPPIIDTWNITPTGPIKSRTAGDFGYQLHIACIKIAYDLENSPPTTQPDDTDLRARANTWKTKLTPPHQNTPPTTPRTEVLQSQEQTPRPPHTLLDTCNLADKQQKSTTQTPLCGDQPNPYQLCPLEITPHEHNSDDTNDLNEADREDDDHI